MAEKKRATDKDYRENQAQAHESWKRKNPDYWKKYRPNNPEYTKRNRELQRERNDQRKRLLELPNAVKAEIAKMEKQNQKSTIISGYYKLIPINTTNIVKMEELLVKIDIFSES